MQIVPIFVNPSSEEGKRYPVEAGLYAVQYPEQETDEWTRNLDNWSDFEYLEIFYEQHKQFLQHLDPEEFAALIRHQAPAIERAVRSMDTPLDELFEPLDKSELLFLSKNKLKLRTISGKPFTLRIYALRIAPNIYLVTGGAIKLTQTMQQHPLTQQELEQLERVKKYLIANRVKDSSAFEDFIEV